MPFEVTAFHPRDLDAVAALIVAIQRDEFGIAITLADQPDLLDIPGFYQTGAGGFWVARSEQGIVGTIGLKDIGEGNVALRKMFVAPEARGGGESGVARQLLDFAVGQAVRSGRSAIYLGTTDRFHAAHRFYEKNGFERIPESALPDAFPRMAVDSIFYRRSGRDPLAAPGARASG